MGQAATAAPGAASADANPSFAAYDVVSVKPVHPDRILFMGVQSRPDGIDGENVTVLMLVQDAYSTAVGLPPDDVVTRLPDWAKSDCFTVLAKMSDAQTAAFAKLGKDDQDERRRAMLQALLADRFQLKVHHETRQVLGYELVVAKGGPKFTEAAVADPEAPKDRDGKTIRGFLRWGPSPPGMQVATGNNCSMEQLASSLTYNSGLNHRIVDKTGLAGKYGFKLTFVRSQGVGPASPGGPTEATASDPAPTIFQALEDQLGLKLQKGTAAVDTVVVDHVDKPAAN